MGKRPFSLEKAKYNEKTKTNTMKTETTLMENYKGYELFSDAAYYDMICVRKVGDTDFNDTIHVSTLQEAIETVDEITALTDYMDWYKNKYGGVIMLSDYWINEFVSGR